MKRFTEYTVGLVMLGGLGVGMALAGEASTSAAAANGYRHPGTAAATANYTGGGDLGFARTRAETGERSRARGLAVGFDQDGLDLSFSHAIATRLGPAYAGTFNLSIGLNGQVSGSYGGALSTGGLVRSAEAGGVTRTDWRGANAQANATGHTAPGGNVVARTNSYSAPRRLVFVPVRVRR